MELKLTVVPDQHVTAQHISDLFVMNMAAFDPTTTLSTTLPRDQPAKRTETRPLKPIEPQLI